MSIHLILLFFIAFFYGLWLFLQQFDIDLRGLFLDGVCIDETAQIEPKLWNEIIKITTF